MPQPQDNNQIPNALYGEYLDKVAAEHTRPASYLTDNVARWIIFGWIVFVVVGVWLSGGLR